MIQYLCNPNSPSTRTPRQVLSSRGVKLAGVSAEGSGDRSVSVRQSVEFHSNGSRSASRVGSVPVERIVASVSCGVASAYRDVASASGQVPPSPKITLPRVIMNIKRAAAAILFQRIRQRLDLIQSARCVSPVPVGRVSGVHSLRGVGEVSGVRPSLQSGGVKSSRWH